MLGPRQRGNLDAIGTLFRNGTLTGRPDAELLALVVDRDDRALSEQAFSALVDRHGPMVWWTCRSTIARAVDAEDAFQATFLVLARRAGSIHVSDSLGPWLHGVARRVALRARKQQARTIQPNPEQHTEKPPPDPLEASEQAAIVRAEVDRLPVGYREAVRLCHLDGLSMAEAAQRLGWPIGTVKGRLFRARAILRERLAGRTRAIMPPLPLRRATVEAVLSLVNATGGWAATGTGPVAAVALAEGVIGAMTMTKSFAIGATLLAAAIGAAGVAAQQGGDRSGGRAAESPASSRAVRPSADAPPGIPREGQKIVLPDYVIEPPDLIRIEVLEALPGRPITGERLVRPDGTVSLNFYGDLKVAGLTKREVKEKFIEHMRPFLPDEGLGLIEQDPQTLEIRKVAPRDSDRVFVDVIAYNSKVYYVGGDVPAPGRLVITGNETVLDAINYVGGVLPTADRAHIALIRPARSPGNPGDQPLKLAIDLDAIEREGDVTTNYQILPGDRLIVYRDPTLMTDSGFQPSAASQPPPTPAARDPFSVSDPTESARSPFDADPLPPDPNNQSPFELPGGDQPRAPRPVHATPSTPVHEADRSPFEIDPAASTSPPDLNDVLRRIDAIQSRMRDLDGELTGLRRAVQVMASPTPPLPSNSRGTAPSPPNER